MRPSWTVISLCLACATTVQRGPLGEPVDEAGHRLAGPRPLAGLNVSAEEIPALASPTFGAVEVTFENTSASWIRISNLALDFGDPIRTAGVQIPGGADLEAWRQATLQRLALFGGGDREPALLALGASVGGQGAQVRAIGAVPSSGADAAFPEYHLLTLPVVIPPALFTKRWVVLNTAPRVPCIRRIVMSYETDDGRRERLALVVRSGLASEWQATACSH
jgi:hypothetical protein